MYKILTVLLLTSLYGCSQKQVAVDNSPQHPTAVINAKGVINGYVLPDSTFTQIVYTRSDRRSIVNDMKYDSWVSRSFLGDADDTTIFRMDKNLRWTLFQNDESKKYIECPLGGCSFASLLQFDNKQDNNNEDQFDYAPDDESDEDSCPTQIVKNTFKVTATGKERVISGYNTKEYRAKWLVQYKDDKGRVDTNKLNIVFWNTDPTASMKKVWKIHDEATVAYRKKIKTANNALAKLIPDDIFLALSAFSGDTAKNNKKWNNKVTRELAKAKGYPMSIKLEWYLDRKACIDKATAKNSKLDWSNPLDAITESASNMVGKQAEKMFLPDPREPIFRYVYEITGLSVKPVHDSVFEIPAGFTLATRE